MDEEHLKKFRDVVCPNSVLKYSTSVVKTRKGNISTSYNVILNLYSNYIVEQIIDKGVGPRKTFTIGKPNIKDEYIRHYIRGLFDGDGTLSIHDNRRLRYVISTASENMAEFLGELFQSLGIDMRRYGINCVINRRDDTLKFYEYLYKDATIWLERKKKKADDLLSSCVHIDEWEKKYKMKYTVTSEWTSEDFDYLISEYKKGRTINEIHTGLGKHTLKQVSNRVHKFQKKGLLERRKVKKD